jgi:hypothetical protein
MNMSDCIKPHNEDNRNFFIDKQHLYSMPGGVLKDFNT